MAKKKSSVFGNIMFFMFVVFVFGFIALMMQHGAKMPWDLIGK